MTWLDFFVQLLERVFNIMKQKNPSMVGGQKKKLVMKPPQVVRVGAKKTSFVNFTDICKLWVCPIEKIFLEFGKGSSFVLAIFADFIGSQNMYLLSSCQNWEQGLLRKILPVLSPQRICVAIIPVLWLAWVSVRMIETFCVHINVIVILLLQWQCGW